MLPWDFRWLCTHPTPLSGLITLLIEGPTAIQLGFQKEEGVYQMNEKYTVCPVTAPKKLQGYGAHK